MSIARESLRRIVIAGSGQVAILAALGLRKALPQCEILVLGLPADPAAFGDRAASALPFTNKLHDSLGIEEAELVRRAGASHRLGVRYIGWGAEGAQGFVPYGGMSEPAAKTRFAREWGGGSQNAGAPRAAGSVAEVLAETGRFAPPSPDRETPLSEIDYALRWHSPAYRDLLIERAQRMQITHVRGDIVEIEPDGRGGIAAITIAGQGRIEADLFVDCSGPSAVLSSRLREYARKDWAEYLPIRRLFFVPHGKVMLALEDRFSLLPEGWLCELAGRDGLQTTLAVGEGIDPAVAARVLGCEPLESVAIAPSRVAKAWLGNVIALADATAEFEPLGFLHLDLAHRQLALLLEMLPGREIEPLERAEYNRRCSLMLDAVRDTLAIQYAAPRARQVFAHIAAPTNLTTALDQFQRRGRLPFRDEAPLLKQEETALLSALGIPPGYPPQHETTTAREIEHCKREFDRKAKAALTFAPPYARWLASVLQPAATQSG